MSPVVIVFLIWSAVIAVLGVAAIAVAPRLTAPRWLRDARRRASGAIDASAAVLGRVGTSAALALAMWSVVIILGWVLGIAARHLQHSVDWPAFHWWQNHHLGGTWSDIWRKLTNIGDPKLTFVLALCGAVFTALIYWRRPFWWVPGVTLILGYVAEKYSQVILKLVVHRGHPPTTHGTWPSGGMARVLLVYGLIIYFIVRRFWPDSPRMWAAGWSLLAVCASVEAYARLNNLEHWTTDVVGGALYGLLLLAMMITAYAPFRRGAPVAARPRVAAKSAALPGEPAS